MGPQFAQMCNINRIQKVEVGGVEVGALLPQPVQEPGPDTEHNPLLGTAGSTVPYFDVHRLTSNQRWTINDQGVPEPPIPPTQAEIDAFKEILAERSNPPVALHASTVTTEVDEEASLVQWDCGDAVSNLVLRSPVFDSCQNGAQVAAQLPPEFSCDRSNTISVSHLMRKEAPTDSIVSLPLQWKVSDALASDAKSYLLFMEQVSTQRTFWVVRDIPATSRSVSMGASRTKEFDTKAIELENFFNDKGYTGPCVIDVATASNPHVTATPSMTKEAAVSPNLFRIHLLAMTTDSPSQVDGVTSDATKLMGMLSGMIFAHATLDVSV